jgi:TRIC channel
VKTGPGKDMYWAQSIVLTFLLCFGGGIIAPFLLGKPPVVLTNDLIVPVLLAAWFLVNRFEKATLTLLRLPLVKHVLAVLAEIFRANGLCAMVALASNELKPTKYYPIPVWGPILLGTIAGCGGLFLPLDKGLASLKAGSPWPLQSAFYGATAFHLLSHDARVRAVAEPVLGLPSENQVRALVAAFFGLVAFLHTAVHPEFNPFTYAHKFAYTVSGIAPPQKVAVAAPATAGAPAGADKKKD